MSWVCLIAKCQSNCAECVSYVTGRRLRNISKLVTQYVENSRALYDALQTVSPRAVTKRNNVFNRDQRGFGVKSGRLRLFGLLSVVLVRCARYFRGTI